ncbi:MAG: Hsp20/alpha crystallin family protein [Abditibacteriales bacterium]|nr:Hsp20/alpha crystallin family protein [Abditibacteriales bacterium]MDW8367539.1 Hsp20/alpha crystallin family protein [Abditibacteriales bacterium]
MRLSRWDPVSEMRALRERVDRLFDDVLGRGHGRGEEAGAAWSPSADVLETADAIVVQMEIAGVHKDDVSVELTNDRLTVKGERKKDSKFSDAHYHRVERAYGHFHRTFTLSVPINADAASATFTNGVLEIRIPKMEDVKPKQIQIGAS